MPPMAGRIWAYLAICDPPEQTAAQIAERLQASRGSVSGMARLLEHVGLIRRGTRSGDRREYFSIPPGTVRIAHGHRQQQLRADREVTEAGLALIADRPPDAQARLRDLHDLYAFFEREWPAILDRWHEAERQTDADASDRQTKGSHRVTVPVIETEQLTKSYGEHRGIVEVDLDGGRRRGLRLPRSEWGRQDHYDPHRPRPHPADEWPGVVFGIETTRRSRRDPSAPRLPAGEFVLYDKLTGGQTLEYFANLRGGVDPAISGRRSSTRLDLDPSRKFKEYSKGNKQKIGLIVALQHRPDLLILDEPTSGLDPLVQQEFFATHPRGEGRGSHGVHVEPRPERGREDLRPGRDHPRRRRWSGWTASRRCATWPITRSSSASPVRCRRREFEALPGVSEVVADDHVLRMRVSGGITPIVRAAARYELADFVSREPSLEETFLAEYGPKKTAGPAEVARMTGSAAQVARAFRRSAGSSAWAASSPRRSVTRAARRSSCGVRRPARSSPCRPGS